MVSRTRAIVVGLLVGAVLLAAALALTAPGRAVAAEEAHVADRLASASCLETWGANEGAVTREAEITGVAPTGVRVRVTMPYAYSVETAEGPVHADTATEATYVVGPLGPRRLSGDTVEPC